MLFISQVIIHASTTVLIEASLLLSRYHNTKNRLRPREVIRTIKFNSIGHQVFKVITIVRGFGWVGEMTKESLANKFIVKR